MLHVIWICVIGLVAGAIAKLLVPGKDPGGWIITAALGIAGSFVGTWAGRLFHFYDKGQSAGFIMSILGAMVLLGLYHLVRPKTA
ncbi:MAG TPA: GlsB/YeaQ/YmgE family stress response membrane protein [Holophagaceae bacterium]|jgi:uncharacterized membrane protein YeaQ/YmgE (transglycosylase-associated protein family)|nr:GlsB/YeaQ/YmgE family stress response membrane protein [Holophagaceae bacterium]